jgi:DNA polymerase-3 subunit delta'
MTWQGIHEHDEVVEQFRHALRAGRLASTFLFVGPPGVGKRTFALKLAQALLCAGGRAEELAPCGTCPACQQVLAGSHPDLEYVARPADKSEIPLELLIGDRDHRLREGLCFRIALKPLAGGRKVAILDDADDLNEEGANCLLKTLEEPPPRAVIILIGTSEQRQLPTIRSRCQVVRFGPLSESTLVHLLQAQGLAATAEVAADLAQVADGSLTRAAELAEADVWSCRRELLHLLARSDWDSLDVSKWLTGFVEAAGEETRAKRERLRMALEQAATFYRQLMRALNGQPVPADPLLNAAVSAAQRWWTAGPQQAADGLDGCLRALAAIDANANLATLIDAWCDELAGLTRGEPVLNR